MTACKLIRSLVASALVLAGCASTLPEAGSRPQRNGQSHASPLNEHSFPLRALTVRFLDRYLVTHSWLTSSACEHGSLAIEDLGDEFINHSGSRYVFPIYEEGGHLFQDWGRDEAPFKLDSFFRSIKVSEPIYAAPVAGAQGERRVVGFKDREDGLRPFCLETWEGLQVAIGMRWHQLSVPEWIKQLNAKHRESGTELSHEVIGGNTWTVVTVHLRPRKPNFVTGPYKFYLLPVGDTGFTIMFWLAATEEALANPIEFAVLGGVFRKMLESVSVEPWSEATAVRYGTLEQMALANLRQDCRKPWRLKGRPSPWCALYGLDSPRTFELRRRVP